MAAAVAVFGSLTSCMDDAHDDLLGIYAPPTDLTITSAQNVDMVKDGNLRTLTIAFSTQEGVNVNMKLVSNKYFLPSTTYTKAVGAAKNGNYVEGSTVNGSAVTDGALVVTADGDNYTIGNSVLFTADGKAYRMSGKVTLVYEPDPEALKLTKCLSVSKSEGLVSLQIGEATVEAIPGAWGMEIGGSGKYLKVDFYSADGDLAPGTYSPADNNNVGPFNYSRGWDPGDLWGIGIEFKNWGTCWMEAGVEYGENISAGDFEVALSGNIYTITYNYNGLWFEYKGELEGLGGGQGGGDTPDTPVDYIEISNFLSAAVNGTTLSLQLAGDGISTTPNAWGGVDVTGDGNYLKIDLFTADGTLQEGTYTPAESSALAEGNFAMGYDTEMWGMQFYNWGTCWMTRADGAETGVHIEDGTITVEKSGDNYIISLQSSVVNVRYTGSINF